MNHHIFLAATEKGKTLQLSYEQEHTCKVVYKPSEDGEGYVFSELWDVRPEKEYPDDHIIVPVRSVYVGPAPYEDNDVFANVIGSDPDPCPSSSWIQLFRDHGIACDQCATDGTFYDSRDPSGRTYFTDYHCGGGIKGGHVINATAASSLRPNSYVYLLPICHNHNSCCTDNTGRNGSGFFMMPESAGTAILLSGYLKK